MYFSGKKQEHCHCSSGYGCDKLSLIAGGEAPSSILGGSATASSWEQNMRSAYQGMIREMQNRYALERERLEIDFNRQMEEQVREEAAGGPVTCSIYYASMGLFKFHWSNAKLAGAEARPRGGKLAKPACHRTCSTSTAAKC